MSVPVHDHPGAVVPCLLYGNPAAAADWLTEVLGFHEAPRGDETGTADRVELERDGAVLVLGRSTGRWRCTSSHTRVMVDDVDDACLRALCAGGAVETGPSDGGRGLREAVVSDPEGNRWELTHRVLAHA